LIIAIALHIVNHSSAHLKKAGVRSWVSGFWIQIVAFLVLVRHRLPLFILDRILRIERHQEPDA